MSFLTEVQFISKLVTALPLVTEARNFATDLVGSESFTDSECSELLRSEATVCLSTVSSVTR